MSSNKSKNKLDLLASLCKKDQIKLSPTCGLLLLNVLYCIFLNYWYSFVPLSYVAKKCIKPLLPTLAWSVLGGHSCRCCSASVASLNIKSSSWPLRGQLFKPFTLQKNVSNLKQTYVFCPFRLDLTTSPLPSISLVYRGSSDFGSKKTLSPYFKHVVTLALRGRGIQVCRRDNLRRFTV